MRKLKREYQDKNLQSILEDSLRSSDKINGSNGEVMRVEKVEEI